MKGDIYISEKARTLSKGNPGAMRFLAEFYTSEASDATVEKIESSGIVGTDLYVLYSDICDCDMETAIKLIDNCPLDLLKHACSRQDYSGKKLVEKYLQDEKK